MADRERVTMKSTREPPRDGLAGFVGGEMVFLWVSEVSARGRAGWGVLVAVKGGKRGPS